MANTPIRIGIIGCGMITQRSHAPAYAKLDGVEITALCDTDPKQIATVREAHAPKATAFADYHEMLAAGLVDAVSIATPVYLHCPMTIAALDAGCHVLCEKPMGMDQNETAQMVAAAHKAGKVLQINLSRRYNPFFQTLAKLIHDGRIGEPRHIRAIRIHTSAPDKGWAPGSTWFVTKKCGGGIVGDIGVHVGDMMQWLFGPVASVSALTDSRRPDIDVVDNATALFRFRTGATGVLELSWTSAVGHMAVEIHGSDAMIRTGANAKDGITIVGTDGTTETLGEADLVASPGDSFQCFASAIRGQAPTPVPGETGHAIQCIVDAILASGEQRGAPVTLD